MHAVNEESGFEINLLISSRGKMDEKKVRDGEAPSPAREARALPGSGNNRIS
jgi:hypothetical protein